MANYKVRRGISMANYIHKDTLTATDKENQELKKANELLQRDGTDMLSMNETLLRKASILKTQQKEFIKWLEDEIKELQKIKETELDYDILKDVIPQLLAYKEILQKHKEIVGDVVK